MDIRNCKLALETAHANSNTPLVTYTTCCEAIGYGTTGDLIALLVANSSWDGRVSKRNIDWALDRLEHRSYDDRDIKDAYTSIHKAHLDQIADIARKLNY